MPRELAYPASDPQGESVLRGEEVRLATPSGALRAVWDESEAVSPMAPVAFFVQFLVASGLWQRAIDDCPLSYTSPIAPRKQDVVGSLMLTVLSGGRRYLHASGLRYDGVVTEVLGMRRLLSHESLRRAIAWQGEHGDGRAQWLEWARQQLRPAVEPVLKRQWILDEDVTSRIIHGEQEGAKVGYNGKRPGHASLALHTYVVGGLRLVLDVQVKPGNETSGAHGHEGLLSLIASLPKEQWPSLVRGDVAYGFDEHMEALENLKIPYLFKLRRSDAVKKLLQTISLHDRWVDAGKGWQGVETVIKLMSWERERRIFVLRRPETSRPAVKLGRRKLRGTPIDGQTTLFPAEPPSDGFEYAILVTSLTLPLREVAQLYRDRADAENINDELKNDWGWGGFTTADLDRTNIMARFTALIYNWWNLYSRDIVPARHIEAGTARPMLLQGVGRLVHHGGQRLLRITGLAHGRRVIAARLTQSARACAAWMATVAQLPLAQRWQAYAQRLLDRVEAALRGHSPPTDMLRVT